MKLSEATASNTCCCGSPARGDGSDYADICTQWPVCEGKEGLVSTKTRLSKRDMGTDLAIAWDVIDGATGTPIGWVVRWQNEDTWKSYVVQYDNPSKGRRVGCGEKLRRDAVNEVHIQRDPWVK